jgi:hypothetical protein
VSYKYKIRLRPDLAVVKPFPLPDKISFAGVTSWCNKTVYYPNPYVFIQGAEDSFNIGEAEDMDHLLDRYVDLTTKPFIYRGWRNHNFWNSESYLGAVMEERYHVCFRNYDDIWMVVIRTPTHQTNYTKEPVPGDDEWVKIQADR